MYLIYYECNKTGEMSYSKLINYVPHPKLMKSIVDCNDVSWSLIKLY